MTVTRGRTIGSAGFPAGLPPRGPAYSGARPRPARPPPAAPEIEMKTRQEFFAHYVRSNPIAHSLWRSFEGERFARESLASPVLDLGCGDGFFAQTVYGHPLDAGIDADAHEVERARRRGSYHDVRQATATALPFPAASFQTVVSNSALEHVPQIDLALAEISRVLQPGGRLLMTVPSEYYRTDSSYHKFFLSVGCNQAAQWYGRALNRAFKHHHLDGAQIWRTRCARAGLTVDGAEYLMNRRAFHAYEKLLILALPAKIWKRLFGRWVLWPRPWLARYLPNRFEKILSETDDKGVVYFISATKTGWSG